MLPVTTVLGGEFMKKVFIWFLVSILVVSATGCGLKRKIENKIGEKIFEGATGGKVDVKGEEVTIKGEDGEEVTFGSTEWPDSDLMKDIPKFTQGNITSVTKSDEIVMILIEEVEQKDFESYCEGIKKDFTEEVVNFEMDDVMSFGASNGKGIYVQVIFNTSDRTLNINSTKQEE
ncbi:MAG: hypothetical protein K0R09_3623 [Clostridiales bacterium]|jgi:hypothetical protein|nr:hypothetical protein [Clostridiales bacterium]